MKVLYQMFSNISETSPGTRQKNLMCFSVILFLEVLRFKIALSTQIYFVYRYVLKITYLFFHSSVSLACILTTKYITVKKTKTEKAFFMSNVVMYMF